MTLYRFQSPWFHCIIIESSIFLWWVSRAGLHVSKERGMKKGSGADAPFRTMLQHTGNMFRKNLRDLKSFRSYSRSHLYAQLGNALQKHVFCIFCFDNGCFKRFHRPIFSFQCWESKFYSGFDWTRFALIFPFHLICERVVRKIFSKFYLFIKVFSNIKP